MVEALQIIKSDTLKDLPEDVMLLEKIRWIAESVFAQQTASVQDFHLVKNLTSQVMRAVVFNTVGTLNYCGYEIPLPPPDIGNSASRLNTSHLSVPILDGCSIDDSLEPKGYSQWFEAMQSERDISTITSVGLHTGAQRQLDSQRCPKPSLSSLPFSSAVCFFYAML